MLRLVLDGGYRLCGLISATFIILILTVVIGQVALNAVGAALVLFGLESVGLLIPSYSDLSGFSLAAATFFGMAYTFRAGGHIRVTLFISQLPERARLVAEVACLATATLITSAMSIEASKLAYESWEFGDKSYGLLALPIWIPQTSFVLGVSAFTICLFDALVTTVVGRPFGKLRAADLVEETS
ncbi:MAG: TRAP transporter small permease [Pseudomonadota bacterium]